eukprot:COSAG06_NODE_376_length_16647_cov_19.266920_4_plen_532_part_00
MQGSLTPPVKQQCLHSYAFHQHVRIRPCRYGWSCDGGRGNRANPKDNDCLIDLHGIPTDRPLPQCDPLPHCDPNEPGFPTDDPEAPAQRACKLRLLCDTQLYMRKNLMSSILRPWSDTAGKLVTNGSMSSGVIKTGMEGAFLLDAGMPEYSAHLTKMATLGTQLLPTAVGVAFDGTGWQGRINLNADDGKTTVFSSTFYRKRLFCQDGLGTNDIRCGNLITKTTVYAGRSFVELHESGETGGPFVRPGLPIHTQVSSKASIQQAMGELLHAHGKAHFWNPYAPRADFMLHTDGVFSEDSYEDERMHLHSTLGIGGKPIITWNPGCESWPSSQCGRYKDSHDNAQLLQRLLYWGVQPMLPFSRNDHAITRCGKRLSWSPVSIKIDRFNKTDSGQPYGNAVSRAEETRRLPQLCCRAGQRHRRLRSVWAAVPCAAWAAMGLHPPRCQGDEWCRSRQRLRDARRDCAVRELSGARERSAHSGAWREGDWLSADRPRWQRRHDSVRCCYTGGNCCGGGAYHGQPRRGCSCAHTSR